MGQSPSQFDNEIFAEIEVEMSILEMANKAFRTEFDVSSQSVSVAEQLRTLVPGGVEISIEPTGEWSCRVSIQVCPPSLNRLTLTSELDEAKSPLLDRLAETTALAIEQHIQLYQRRKEVEFLAMQVSQDFEELSWLRECGIAIQSLGIRANVNDLGEQILGSLVEVIHPRQIAMVTYLEPVPVEREHRWENWGNITSFGADEFSEQSIQETCLQFGSRALKRPVVSRAPFDCEDGQQTEFMLVPVRIDSKLFGWLLAIGACHSVEDRIHYGDQIHDSSFGSFQAGLLASAGSYLGAFAESRLLYSEQEELLVGVVRALVNTIDAKDPYTCGHSDRVAGMSRIIGQQLGLDATSCDQLHLAGLLHDIGKIGIPDAILKKPGKLTEEEYDLLKMHPVIGYQVLKNLKQMSYVLDGVLYHHEAIDGSGYPDGLMSDKIPLPARIIAVADAFDAMTSNRPYRAGMPIEKAEAILQLNRGPQWDPEILDAFFAAQDTIYEFCLQRGSATQTVQQRNDLVNDSVVIAFD